MVKTTPSILTLLIFFLADIASSYSSFRDGYYTATTLINGDDVKYLKQPLKVNKNTLLLNPNRKINVGIVGAGMSGLYAALILDSLNIDFELHEASGEHLGGRIFTYHFSKKKENASRQTCAEYNDYVEMGPMRFTKKTTRLVGDETWSLVNYLNNHPENIHQARKQLKLVPYIFNSENEFFYFNGRKIFASNSQMNDTLGFGDSENGGTGTGVPDSYTARPFWEWSDLVVQPFLKLMDTNVTLAYSFLKKYDTHSMRSFLATFDAQKLLDEMGLLTEDYQSPIDPRTGSRLDREYPQMGNIII